VVSKFRSQEVIPGQITWMPDFHLTFVDDLLDAGCQSGELESQLNQSGSCSCLNVHSPDRANVAI